MRCLYLTSSSRYSPWRHLDFWSCSGKRFTKKTVVCTRFIATPKMNLPKEREPGHRPTHWNPIQGRQQDWAELRRLFGSRNSRSSELHDTFLSQLDLKNVQPVLSIAAESFLCGHLIGDLDVLLVPRVRGSGDGARPGMNLRFSFLASRNRHLREAVL